MDIEDARYLVSPGGLAALAGVPGGVRELPLGRMVEWFRRRYPAKEAAALSLQVSLRAKAVERLGPGPSLLLTPEGAQMMTHHLVAARRAVRVAGLGLPTVVDLTCGVGSDLRALATTGAATVGMEREPVTAMLAASNVPEARVVQGDATRPPLRLAPAFVFVDPSRRSGARRGSKPEDYSPPLDAALRLAREGLAGCVKAAPGIPNSLVPEDAEMEVVELGSSLREAALWVGGDARAGLRRAVRLPGGHEIDSAHAECAPEPVVVGRFLVDPRSCVTRAGLVRHLGARMGARLVDPHLGYLTMDTPRTDPLGETFEVLEVIPFSLKRVREVLRQRRWDPAQIRRRAFPVEPDEFDRMLNSRSEGETPVTLFLTTIGSKRTVVVGRPWGGEA